MRRFLTLRALAVLAALTLVPFPALGSDFAQTTEHLYIHNGAVSCADDSQLFLVYEKPATGSNCGYIYGAPLNEADHHGALGVFVGREYTTPEEGFGIVLDASRDLTGKVVVSSRTSVCVSPAPPQPPEPAPTLPPACHETNQGTGAGQVIVDIVASGETSNFDSISLGSAQVSTNVVPGTVNYELPFTINLPDDVDRSELANVKLYVNPRGVHIHSGYVDASGRSFIDVPSLTPIEPTL